MKNISERLYKELFSSISKYINMGDRYIFIEYPFHSNIGDHAIWLGAKRCLNKITGRNYNRCVVSLTPPTDDIHVGKYDKIIIHGGGNFGTIYRNIHNCKLKWIEKYHDRKIIQLPQTVFFNEDDTENSLYRTCKAIEKCKNFIFMARDHVSYEFAHKHFPCETVLVPDMAFALHDKIRRCNKVPEKNKSEIKFLLRTDKESIGHKMDGSTDWVEKTKFMRLIKKMHKKLWIKNNIHLTKLLFFLSLQSLFRGKKILCQGKTVISDRLHAHILCTLFEIPHVILDNNYGKISSFVNTWETIGNYSALASSLEEAVDKARYITSKIE